jgi:hypothetical protein
MERLVFIDDDKDELESFQKLVSRVYECVPIHWPRRKPTEEHVGARPVIFVSDLCLPPGDCVDDLVDFPAKELEDQAKMAEGITVNAIAPALIETDMVTSNPNANPNQIPMGHFGAVEDMASVAVMLAMNEYMTGQTVSVNGGGYMS